MQQGIPIEKAREIVKLIKDSKKKVQRFDPGRPGPGERKRSRRAAGDHCAAAAGRISASIRSLRITGPIRVLRDSTLEAFKLGTNRLSTPATIDGKEIFELLRGDLVGH